MPAPGQLFGGTAAPLPLLAATSAAAVRVGLPSNDAHAPSLADEESRQIARRELRGNHRSVVTACNRGKLVTDLSVQQESQVTTGKPQHGQTVA